MKHIPRKRFGQNFLTDHTVLEAITRLVAPQPDDVMVEIGPGLGAMTRLLLASLKHLHVVEIDRDLVGRLQKTFRVDQLTIHQGDALAFDFSNVHVPVGRKLRVVGNLPYNISTPLLFHLAQFAPIVQDQHFMLQKEVVERMVAEPGSKVYGRLSVMLQWRYQMTLELIVPPSAFDPPPKVESAIVRMIPLAQPLACDLGALGKVVTTAFSQRRKVLRNCLSGLFTENDLIASGIDPQARAETVQLERFVALANRLPVDRRHAK
ncbi:MAG: 16S rRNA (adenine(1518)-N(6)/adenine(1519)-N(6))-dimethyltransferase RsmA [Oxalobacter sp.]|nr:MAG: 16S rRNA (adenine(1518)-N(6)/adenine(1519)-N(6))-dimethyltransferase RsmA [Oxalobacter sp.]